jgi:alpha-galactosidase
MMGKLGFDIVVSKLPANDLQYVQGAVKTYNALKPIIWQGDQYRLSDPRESNVASVLYVNEQQSAGVIFNYLVNNRYGVHSAMPIRLKGLKPAGKYKIKEVNVYPGAKSTIDESKTYSGDFLMKVGFNPDVSSHRTSVVLQIDEI